MTFTRQDALDYLHEIANASEQMAWIRLQWRINFGLRAFSDAMDVAADVIKDALRKPTTLSSNSKKTKSKPHYHHLNPNNKWRLK